MGLDCFWKFCDEKVFVDESVMLIYSIVRLSFVIFCYYRVVVCFCKEGRCLFVYYGCEDDLCFEGFECVFDFWEEKYICVCFSGRFG